VDARKPTSFLEYQGGEVTIPPIITPVIQAGPEPEVLGRDALNEMTPAEGRA